MDIGSIFLVLALLVLVGMFVSRPFFETKDALHVSANVEDQQRSALLAERDRVLNALQELDFDFALGKIPEEDYPGQRQRLLANGAEVLRQLDALQEGETDDDVDARLEAAIASRRADAERAAAPATAHAAEALSAAEEGGAPVAALDDELEVLLANRRRARREKSAGFCPQCGGALQKSDRFCPKCGNSLA